MTALASGMMFIAGIFFVLGAEFLGVVQIVVYGGSVVALYAFAMMFFNSSREIVEVRRSDINAAILSFGIAIVLVAIFGAPALGSHFEHIAYSQSLLDFAAMNNIQKIGYILFTKYLIPFEIAAFMLLVAMVAGIILSVKRSGND